MNATSMTMFVPALLGLLVLGGGPAQASDVQDRIDQVIEEHGGEQTAWNEVSWDGGETVLTLSGEFSALSVGSCADGKFCAYSLPGYLGARLTFSTCTSNLSVASLGGPVRSIANARASGTVTAYNGSTPLFGVVAGTGTNTVSTITKLSCG